MKKYITFILFVTLFVNCFSQSGTKKVEVIDVNNQESIIGAHIFVTYDNDSTAIFVTDKFGKAKLDLAYPKAMLKVTAIGFEDYKTRIVNFKSFSVKMKEDRNELDPIVITGQFNGTRKTDAIQKVTVISRSKIDAMGANALNEVLTNEAGIRISQDPVLGSGVSLQGVSGENVKILINGVPLIGRTNGNIDLSQVNLATIERIEIIEGPMSVSYGSNALGGVINLITRKRNQYPFEIGVKTYWENIGKYNLDGHMTFDKNNHHLMLSGGRYYFDGWNINDPFFKNPTPIADSRRNKLWNPKEQYLGDLNYHYRAEKWHLSSRFSYMNEKVTNKGLPSAPYNETAFDDIYKTQRIDVSLNSDIQLGKNGKLSLLAAFSDFVRKKNTYFIDLTTLESNLTNDSENQDTTLFKQIMSRGSYAFVKDSSKLHFRIGYDFNLEQGVGKRILNNQRNILDVALFGSLNYTPIKDLSIRPGVRYAYNSAYKTPVLPSLHIRYKFAKKYTLRASYAMGFRAPAIKELYLDFVDVNHNIVGNENLKAETSNNVNASLIYGSRVRRSFVGLEVSGFYNAMKNLISLANTNGTSYTYANIGRFKTWGVKAELKYRFKAFSLTTSFSNIARYNLVSEDQDAPIYSHSQDVTAALGYQLKKIKLSVNLFYKYQGKLPSFIVDENDLIQQRYVGDFHHMDLTISKSFWKKQIVLTIGCKNIFNVVNIESSTTTSGAHSTDSGNVSIAPGRTVFTSLQFRFNHFKKNK